MTIWRDDDYDDDAAEYGAAVDYSAARIVSNRASYNGHGRLPQRAEGETPRRIPVRAEDGTPSALTFGVAGRLLLVVGIAGLVAGETLAGLVGLVIGAGLVWAAMMEQGA